MAASLAELLRDCPHLASPAALASVDLGGKFSLPRHLAYLNRKLVEASMTPSARLMVNMPFQHGKSLLASQYFPAWYLLLWPEARIIHVTHSDRFAMTFGSKVKDVIARFGKDHGVELRKDQKAKDEWVIRRHGGGMVCRGPHGGITGRPADLLLVDDLIKDAEEARSQAVMDSHWDWYQTVAFSRLGPTAQQVLIGTRWGVQDLFGHVLKEAKETGEGWEVVKFTAIARENDILGRAPGEALWPERVPLKRLEQVREKRGRWFSICWDQNPIDEEGDRFRPDGWPCYEDAGDAYWLAEKGPRRVARKEDVLVFATADWAATDGKNSDKFAGGVFGLLPWGDVMVLHVRNKKLRLELQVPELAQVCREWRPFHVAVESDGFQEALAQQCRQYWEIPEPERLKAGTKNKLARALPALTMGESRSIYLPGPNTRQYCPWLAEYKTQLQEFTGADGEADDMVDVTSYACMLARRLGQSHGESAGEPVLLVPGRGI